MSLELDHIREEMRLKHDEELIDILGRRDEEEWHAEVFQVIEEVLRERGVSISEALAQFEASSAATEAPDPTLREEDARLVVLTEFDSFEDAQLCRMALQAAGIPAHCRRPTSELGTLAAKVEVAAIYEKAALEVLEAASVASEQEAEAEAEDEEFKCRHCGFISEPIKEGSRLVCQVCGESS